MIGLYILGHPAPQGSKRHVGRGIMVEASKKVTPWREAVVAECQREGVAGRMLDGPLSVFISFYFPRPASHHDAKGEVRSSAPLYPIRRSAGDIDKLIRSTLDALVQASTIADDSLVATIQARKRYATMARPSGAALLIVPIGEIADATYTA